MTTEINNKQSPAATDLGGRNLATLVKALFSTEKFELSIDDFFTTSPLEAPDKILLLLPGNRLVVENYDYGFAIGSFTVEPVYNGEPVLAAFAPFINECYSHDAYGKECLETFPTTCADDYPEVPPSGWSVAAHNSESGWRALAAWIDENKELIT